MSKSVKTLLDMARSTVPTDAALARRIGVPATHIAMFRSGARPISPETAVLLCDVLQLPGDETREWVAIAMLDNPKNAERAAVLRRALFACWALGAALTTGHYSADAMAMTGQIASPKTPHVTGQKLTFQALCRIAAALLARRPRIIRFREKHPTLRVIPA